MAEKTLISDNGIMMLSIVAIVGIVAIVAVQVHPLGEPDPFPDQRPDDWPEPAKLPDLVITNMENFRLDLVDPALPDEVTNKAVFFDVTVKNIGTDLARPNIIQVDSTHHSGLFLQGPEAVVGWPEILAPGEELTTLASIRCTQPIHDHTMFFEVNPDTFYDHYAELNHLNNFYKMKHITCFEDDAIFGN